MKNFFSKRIQVQIALLLCCCSAFCISCTTHKYIKTAKAYFNAYTVENKSKYMAADYRSYFLGKQGEGSGKQSALQSFQQWDAPLHPDIKILQSHFEGNEGAFQINEQNDFSKLINFPGWKATTHVKFNADGLITEMIYIPDSTNPDYKQWLRPAIDWLQKQKPGDLNQVYKNGKLVQNETTAKQWVELLKAWKKYDAQMK